jgi:nitrogen regulatory protein P-II 1
MKKIEAIVRPEKVGEVRVALEAAGCPGVMVTEIEGYGKQKGIVEQWRGETYRVSLLPKVKMEIVVKDKDVKSIIKAIADVARTGEIGDGKIFVYPIEDAYQIRTGATGDDAI